MTTLLVFVALVLAYGLVSRLLGRHAITGPIVFVAAGLLVSPDALDIISVSVEEEAVRLLAELTLAIVLFTDAGRIDFIAVRHSPQIPVRLLAIAMPLTIGAGIAVGAVLLADLEFWEAAIVAAVLAPTDAALGQAVVSNMAVPARVRQGLNVESGLNDGLSVPFLFIFIAFAGIEGNSGSTAFWVQFIVEQIGLGVLVGLAVGLGGAWLLKQALR
ncbi:MAG: cation:proton antiporter, partial [Thermoleophilia bacterium]|nr:cation:proton antiporter [Thermoleophilia bacterium]